MSTVWSSLLRRGSRPFSMTPTETPSNDESLRGCPGRPCAGRNVPSSQTASQVRQLASAIGHCYHVEPDYETTSGDGTTTARDEVFAIVDLPDSISIYINGVAGTVWMSVTATDALDEVARRLKGGSASPSPAADPLNDEVLSRVPDEFAHPENSVPFARLPARQPTNQYLPGERVYPPAAGREVDGVRSPRDGSS